jgi:hypothetical protein
LPSGKHSSKGSAQTDPDGGDDAQDPHSGEFNPEVGSDGEAGEHEQHSPGDGNGDHSGDNSASPDGAAGAASAKKKSKWAAARAKTKEKLQEESALSGWFSGAALATVFSGTAVATETATKGDSAADTSIANSADTSNTNGADGGAADGADGASSGAAAGSSFGFLSVFGGASPQEGASAEDGAVDGATAESGEGDDKKRPSKWKLAKKDYEKAKLASVVAGEGSPSTRNNFQNERNQIKRNSKYTSSSVIYVSTSSSDSK